MVQVGHQENFLYRKGTLSIGMDCTQGVTIRGGAHETAACSTQCHGLVEKVMTSQRLELIISEVFCYLNHSVFFTASGCGLCAKEGACTSGFTLAGVVLFPVMSDLSQRLCRHFRVAL